MPTLSTPASPTPFTEEGDHLLVELREFLQNVSNQNTSLSTSNIRAVRRDAQMALRLLRQLPVARQAILDYYSGLFNMSVMMSLEPSSNDVSADHENLSATITDLQTLLMELLKTNGPAWAPLISQWTLTLLGDISSTHAQLIVKSYSASSGVSWQSVPQPLPILESLPIWLSLEAGRILAELTVECISMLRDQDDSQTEKCVSALLEASVRHGPHFDWVVAHVGGCFPDTVISRVLAVGLKDFVSYGSTQKSKIAKEGSVNVTNIPKINSVVGILSHLGGTNHKEIVDSIRGMVISALDDSGDDGHDEDEDVDACKMATIPYLICLSTLSEMIGGVLLQDVKRFLTLDVARKIENLVPEWLDIYFPRDNAFLSMVIQLAKYCSGLTGRDVIHLLFEFGGEENSPKQVRFGCRHILDRLLGDLLEIAHRSATGDFSLPLIKACCDNFMFFADQYLLTDDIFQRKSMLLLTHIVVVAKGRPPAVSALTLAIEKAETEEDLETVLILIRDLELWIPDIVEEAVRSCLRHRRHRSNVLDNLGKFLHMQRDAAHVTPQTSPSLNQPERLKVVTNFAKVLQGFITEILPFLSEVSLIPKALKLLHFTNYSAAFDSSVGLMYDASQSVAYALFTLFRERHCNKSDAAADETFLSCVMICTAILSSIASQHRPSGLQIVLRVLIEAAIDSPFAAIFGGKWSPHDISHENRTSKKKNLFEENFKFGSMPTQPLGTSTVFHAGVIGQGKRGGNNNNGTNTVSPDETEMIETNTFMFVSLLFKICHFAEKPSSANEPKPSDIERREMSKEACKQLSLLLVDLVSPDVMYNGLPWPDEEFTRVTVERDLKIHNTLRDHPLLWKILWGLAEARPALCYCSVLLRAVLAVQMYYWQSSLNQKAADSPVQLETTRQVLQLMSIGQFIPPPLDGVAEVLAILHPFHVHCILVDIWNYVRDNVPSPAPFACNSNGILVRDFEPYKNYKQYCERLRLILIKHIAQVPQEFRRFFIDNQVTGD